MIRFRFQRRFGDFYFWWTYIDHKRRALMWDDAEKALYLDHKRLAGEMSGDRAGRVLAGVLGSTVIIEHQNEKSRKLQRALRAGELRAERKVVWRERRERDAKALRSRSKKAREGAAERVAEHERAQRALELLEMRKESEAYNRERREREAQEDYELWKSERQWEAEKRARREQRANARASDGTKPHRDAGLDSVYKPATAANHDRYRAYQDPELTYEREDWLAESFENTSRWSRRSLNFDD